VRDLGSSNGTYVNGQRVSERALAERDILRCGEWVGLVVPADTLPVDVRAGIQLLVEGVWGGPELASAIASLEKAARLSTPVVVQGQPGTGKASVARAVHRWSGLPGDLVVMAGRDSPDGVETWGPRSNGFDSASFNVERAQQGTLLLENLPDIDPALQRSLGTVLSSKTAAGGAGARLVATLDGSFSEAARSGRIDERLAGCLSGVVVELPALVERIADIPELFFQLLGHYTGGQPPEVTARVVERLCLYRWPGNVGELDLLARQMAATHPDKRIVGRGDLPPELLGLDAPRARV
jgi:DNA-binding NtrC family response regulator